ncbi:replicative DNA helicase [Tissierella sp. MB52-C2]|uniref:replicative DNA helicase n=1 Tax=Tissierella sp. MB52-C2 TaxID=3070999 RepID=UPI00280A696D|nr:replicative DNA helicase [Tissierella sp. MB52-C2]WMM24076.1 replicative DNA helicase [Tissierella sp. MB52-C2]
MYKDIETERAVLACMIIDGECSLDYGLLNVDDFTDGLHKKIFIGIQNIVKKEKQVDYLTLYIELNKQVDVSYLATLSESLPTTANFKQYVEQLKDVSLKRKLYKLADGIRDPNKTGEELAELAEKEIFELREETSTSEFTRLDGILLDVYQRIEKVSSGELEMGLKTGYDRLDDIIGGLRNSEYILLGARPSIGKTALAINIAGNLLTEEKTIAFFSYEMSKEQLVERLLKSMSLVQTGYKREMDVKEWTKLQNTANYLLNKNLLIDDDPNKMVSDMQSMCRKLKRQEGLDLVIVDYLQKVKSNSKGTKREQLEQVSNDIKNMAKMLDVPVLVVSSLSRANETRDVKIPVMSDLRETGQLEFDADVIMFLHREYYYDRTNIEIKRDADIVIAKNRNGRVGRTKLTWYEEYTKFLNRSESYERN